MRFLFIVMGILLFSSPTSAAETKCDAWAYTVTDTKKELLLRKQPNNKAKVTGKTMFLDGTGAECHLLKAKGEWVYVDCEPRPAPDLNEKWVKGWVKAIHFGTSVGPYAPNDKNSRFYSAPNYQSKSIKLPQYKDTIYGQLTSCKDKWIKIKIKDPSKDMLEQLKQPEFPKEDLIFLNKVKKGTYPREGWLAPDSHCHNPLTTCS